MTLRTRLLKVADKVRTIAGSTKLDQRTHKITVRVRTWSGGRKGADAPVTSPVTPDFTDVDLVLEQKFPVRQLSVREIAASGDTYEIGDIIVEHITPSYVDPVDGLTKGYTPAQLRPIVTSQAVELFYVVEGPHHGEYACSELRSWKNYSYSLVLTRRATTPSSE